MFQTRSFSRSVHARRYAIYLDYLKARAGHYDQVMMSDVRDVVFQSHPFAGIDSPKCHFYLEAAGRTIGSDATNARWVRGCFTAGEAEALAPRRISCSGITIGGTAEIMTYLEHMVAKIDAMPLRIYRTIGHGYDQGIHNYLVYLDAGISGVVEENNGHIATMALEPRDVLFARCRRAHFRAGRPALSDLPPIRPLPRHPRRGRGALCQMSDTTKSAARYVLPRQASMIATSCSRVGSCPKINGFGARSGEA